MVPIRKLLKKDNTSVIELLMFYKNKKSMIFKVLGSVIYCITEKCLFVDYICLQKYQLYLVHKGFENKTLNDISGIGIQVLLINIMPFHGFVDNKN